MIGYLSARPSLWPGSPVLPGLGWNCACGVAGDEDGVSVPEDAVNNPTMTNWPCPEEVADTHPLSVAYTVACASSSVRLWTLFSLSLAQPPLKDGKAPVDGRRRSERRKCTGPIQRYSSCLGEVGPFRRSTITAKLEISFSIFDYFPWLTRLPDLFDQEKQKSWGVEWRRKEFASLSLSLSPSSMPIANSWEIRVKRTLPALAHAVPRCASDSLIFVGGGG